MNTGELIDRLAADATPVPRNAVARRLAVGIALGMVVSFTIVVATVGMRPDLRTAVFSFAFWMKWSYTISLAAIAIFTTAGLARPEAGSLHRLRLIAIPFALLAVLGAGELAHTPPPQWLAMWLGHSWRQCPWLVLGLAGPIFLGLLWSFRQFAPTGLRGAGAAAGLAAGAFSATVYCLHCPEVSAIFVLTWYSLGILLAALLGALIGPRLLHW